MKKTPPENIKIKKYLINLAHSPLKNILFFALVLIGSANVSIAQNPVSTATATATATVRTALTINKNNNLSFGAFTVESAGKISVDINESTEITGGFGLTGSPASSASFLISGDNEGHFALTLPTAPISLSAAGKPSMVIAPESWVTTLGGATVLSGVLSTEGKLPLKVGATLGFAQGQPVGTYTGEFDIKVAYE